jgi:hypothetical protein
MTAVVRSGLVHWHIASFHCGADLVAIEAKRTWQSDGPRDVSWSTLRPSSHGVDWLAEQPAIPEYHASPETLAAIRAIDREKTEHQRPRQRRQAPI